MCKLSPSTTVLDTTRAPTALAPPLRAKLLSPSTTTPDTTRAPTALAPPPRANPQPLIVTRRLNPCRAPIYFPRLSPPQKPCFDQHLGILVNSLVRFFNTPTIPLIPNDLELSCRKPSEQNDHNAEPLLTLAGFGSGCEVSYFGHSANVARAPDLVMPAALPSALILLATLAAEAPRYFAMLG